MESIERGLTSPQIVKYPPSLVDILNLHSCSGPESKMSLDERTIQISFLHVLILSHFEIILLPVPPQHTWSTPKYMQVFQEVFLNCSLTVHNY